MPPPLVQRTLLRLGCNRVAVQMACAIVAFPPLCHVIVTHVQDNWGRPTNESARQRRWPGPAANKTASMLVRGACGGGCIVW